MDIVERLLCTTRFDGGIKQFLDERTEAATEITQLREQVKVMRVALAGQFDWIGESDCPVRIGNDTHAAAFDMDWQAVMAVKQALAKVREVGRSC